MQLRAWARQTHPNHLITYYIYMLCAKYGSGQSADCPAQTSDPGFTQPIHGLPACSPPHLFTYACKPGARLECEVVRAASLCDRAMGHREAFDDWMKNTFLSAKKTGSKVLTRSQGEEIKTFLSGATPAKDAHFKFWVKS